MTSDRTVFARTREETFARKCLCCSSGKGFAVADWSSESSASDGGRTEEVKHAQTASLNAIVIGYSDQMTNVSAHTASILIRSALPVAFRRQR